MTSNVEQLAQKWITESAEAVGLTSANYCKTRDVFQARLEKMANELMSEQKISEEVAYILTAIGGEIGNNSFDHNVGNWPDILGIFFDYEIQENEIVLILADRGRGILFTLSKIKPELKNDIEALQVAFTEKISGRAPENRGNGLKFVRQNVKDIGMHLDFYSGNAHAKLNSGLEIHEFEKTVAGCLAIIKVKF